MLRFAIVVLAVSLTCNQARAQQRTPDIRLAGLDELFKKIQEDKDSRRISSEGWIFHVKGFGKLRSHNCRAEIMANDDQSKGIRSLAFSASCELVYSIEGKNEVLRMPVWVMFDIKSGEIMGEHLPPITNGKMAIYPQDSAVQIVNQALDEIMHRN